MFGSHQSGYDGSGYGTSGGTSVMGGARPRMLTRHAVAESDDELTDRVRSGDHSAYGELYRRHQRAAQSTARCLLRSRADADDVVAEAFAGVLAAIRNGRGPQDNFRRYLLACVRNGCRVRQRSVPVAPEDVRFEQSDRPRTLLEDPERFAEADVVARAFSALAPRWQEMLWATAVEQKSPQEAGQQMALSPNAAAALAHRARQAFATAYLAEHVGHPAAAGCESYAPHLAAYVRDQLPAARSASVDEHVRHCPSCGQAVADLRDVNSALRSLLPAPAAAIVGVGAATEMAVTTGVLGGGLSAGLPFGGLFLKGLAGVLLLAPVLVSDASPFDTDAADRRDPVVEVDEAAGGPVGAVPAATVVVVTASVPVVTVAVATEPDASAASGGGTTPIATTWVTVPAVVTPPAATLPAVTLPAVSTPTLTVAAALDGTLATLGIPQLVEALGATVDEVVGLVGTAADAVVTEVVQPVVDRAVMPFVAAATELIAGLVESVTNPLEPLVVVGDPLSATSVPAGPGGSAPTATLLPSVGVPSITGPAGSTPSISAPPVSGPAVTVPVVATPAVTIPAVTIAPITVPSLTTPTVVVPIVTIAVPSISLPGVSLLPASPCCPRSRCRRCSARADGLQALPWGVASRGPLVRATVIVRLEVRRAVAPPLVPARQPSHASEPARRGPAAFLATEAGGALVLLAAALVALVWANSPWSASYEALWETPVRFGLGSFDFDEDLAHFVNDALMALFFFVVGLEIKREMVVGELRDPRRVGRARARGARRHDRSGGDLHGSSTRAEPAPAGGRSRWRPTSPSPSASSPSWAGRAAGRDVAVAHPRRRRRHRCDHRDRGLLLRRRSVLRGSLRRGARRRDLVGSSPARCRSAVAFVVAGVIGLWLPCSSRACTPRSPGVALPRPAAMPGRRRPPTCDRWIRALHPWTSFVVVPLFALANAGVDLHADVSRSPSTVFVGVLVGLVVGKFVGMTRMTWLVVRLGLGRLGPGVTRGQVAGLGSVAGIGFTVSLFIAGLAFDDRSAAGPGRSCATLVASCCAGRPRRPPSTFAGGSVRVERDVHLVDAVERVDDADRARP